MPSAARNMEYDGSASTTSQRLSNFPRFAREFDAEPVLKWQNEVQKQLLSFAKFQRGWDSYGAEAIGWDAGLFTLSLLNDFMRPRTPLPQVVPSSAGGVQLEWHQKGIDLEIHVTGPYKCELWFKDHYTPDEPLVERELNAPGDYEALRKPFDLLTQR